MARSSDSMDEDATGGLAPPAFCEGCELFLDGPERILLRMQKRPGISLMLCRPCLARTAILVGRDGDHLTWEKQPWIMPRGEIWATGDAVFLLRTKGGRLVSSARAPPAPSPAVLLGIEPAPRASEDGSET